MKRFLTTMVVLISLFAACKKDKPKTAPSVTTAALTNVTTTSATAGGTITGDGNSPITKAGIVWSKTNATPTITDTVVASTTTTGSFTVNLSNLDFGTIYYIRAFATNSIGTSYGSPVTLNTTNDTTKVRFTYMGQTVTYGTLISPTTGRKWMDRNLGASAVPTSFSDTAGFGDYFQWGRLADGHQKKNSDTTGVLSSTDVPGHNKFIVEHTPYTDWRNPFNDNLWQGSTGINNPCPSGWHVPTSAEWTAEAAAITDFNSGFNVLKLTAEGYKGAYVSIDYGGITAAGTFCYYWSSTPLPVTTPPTDINAYYYRIVAAPRAPTAVFARNAGMAVRCIHD